MTSSDHLMSSRSFQDDWRQRAEFLSRYGLYHPESEHDACGVGLVAAIDGKPRREIVEVGTTLAFKGVVTDTVYDASELTVTWTLNGAQVLLETTPALGGWTELDHTFDVAGNHNITLTVTNPEGDEKYLLRFHSNVADRGLTSATGSGGAHNHGWSGSASSSFTGSAINLDVQFVDIIIYQKDWS